MRASIIALVLLTAACGGATQYQRYAGPVPSSPDVTYQCVQEELTKMGYKRSQYDVNTHWYVGQKEERDQVASPLYRKTIEKLDVKVTATSAGATSLTIDAHTLQEFTNQRGVDVQEQQATDRVKRDAQLLARACSGGGAAQ
ncbi:MAG TPA: hypothetical protein VG817_03980 [Gemmatimonadales bacterium]|nr:hypothetical protein [Gemmatimonadales bacterium]